MSWLESIRSLPLSRLAVHHEPETPRYRRARSKVLYLLNASELLGVRPADYPGAVELALWAPAPSGRGNGYYSCLRVFVSQDREATAGLFFCFWDGTEASPGFRSLDAARAHAISDGFRSDDD